MGSRDRVLGRYSSFMVVGLQAILDQVIQGETLAVAASTLVAFALFQPVRRRVQTAVDHRFNRARYDADGPLPTSPNFSATRPTLPPSVSGDIVGPVVDIALRPTAPSASGSGRRRGRRGEHRRRRALVGAHVRAWLCGRGDYAASAGLLRSERVPGGTSP